MNAQRVGACYPASVPSRTIRQNNGSPREYASPFTVTYQTQFTSTSFPTPTKCAKENIYFLNFILRNTPEDIPKSKVRFHVFMNHGGKGWSDRTRAGFPFPFLVIPSLLLFILLLRKHFLQLRALQMQICVCI